MGSADAQHNFLLSQVELFLFDLKNEATEHGFGKNDPWHLQTATDKELTDLKRQNHLVISVRLQPDLLLKMYQQVKSKLQQSLSVNDAGLTVADLIAGEKMHLAAYPTK